MKPSRDLSTIQMVKLVMAMVSLVLIIFAVIVIGPDGFVAATSPVVVPLPPETEIWQAPDTATIPNDKNGKLIEYGRELIAHTSNYLGPNGSVSAITNGMNCQNCHIDAGTKIFGNNYSVVASTYPKFRARSGTEETIEKRVNDCIERSLNGKPLANDSHEMTAIVAYIKWVGKDVEKGKSPKGVGLLELPFLDRPASAENGKIVYDQKCTVCHGKSGEGIALADGSGYQFPPLWGSNSYNIGAGLFRLSRFAGYVKANMPWGATYDAPQLTDEEAWDVAAFVNSFPRPKKDLSNDWPDISKKPIDHPFGPFTDSFGEMQHKLGPFKPIEEERKSVVSSR